MTDTQQRAAAKAFAKNWKDRGYEKGDSQIFWVELLTTVFGVTEISQFISFEDQVHLDHTSFIDGYIEKTHVMIEQKSINKSLTAAIRQSDGSMLTPFEQAKRYSSELPYSKRPRWIVTSNFQSFYIYDMEKPGGDPEIIRLEDLEKEYYFTHIAEHYLQEQIPGALIFSYGNALYSLCPDIDEKQLTKITNFIHGELKKNHVLMSAAISSHSENLSEIPLLRSQTVEIFNTLKNSSHFVMLYRDLETNPVAVMYEKSNYFQVLLNSLSSGDKTMIQRHFDEISQFFTRQTPDEFNSFMYSFMTLFLSFFQSASTELSDSVRQITKTQKELFSTSSLPEKKTEIFQDWMFQIAGLLNTDKINKNNYLTSQLIEYIRANYEKPLSLYSIADEFNRSTPYISRLIKQTTGKNFTDLLTDLRIQKAKELLKTSSYHVNEISHMVGYPNFRYFSRIFKQQTGMTPNDYRKISCRFH